MPGQATVADVFAQEFDLDGFRHTRCPETPVGVESRNDFTRSLDFRAPVGRVQLTFFGRGEEVFLRLYQISTGYWAWYSVVKHA